MCFTENKNVSEPTHIEWKTIYINDKENKTSKQIKKVKK